MRQQSLGIFHALGRLLWCKRVPPFADAADDTAPAKKRRKKPAGEGPEPQQLPFELLFPKAKRPPLYFVPEDVLAASNTDHQIIVHWLFTNAPRFFGDVDDLASFAESMASADAWGSGGGASFSWAEKEVEGAQLEQLATHVQVRSLLDANLHPCAPTFHDPLGPPRDEPGGLAFNMAKPRMWDVARHRNRRTEELAAHLQNVGPLALGTMSASSRFIIKTLPSVHHLLSATRGTHPKLPVEMMILIRDLSSPIDGDNILRTEEVRSSQTAVQSELPSWHTDRQPLEDDPIEDV